MSTKIYVAYRTKNTVSLAEFWEMVGSFHDIAVSDIKTSLRFAYNKIASAINSDSQEYKERTDSFESDRQIRLSVAEDILHRGYREASKSDFRSVFNLDTRITFWYLDGRVYLIPYIDDSSLIGGALDFLECDDRLENYCYFNDTDRPDEVSEEEWERRRETWDILFKTWNHRVTLEICAWGDSFWRIDPYFELWREKD